MCLRVDNHYFQLIELSLMAEMRSENSVGECELKKERKKDLEMNEICHENKTKNVRINRVALETVLRGN